MLTHDCVFHPCMLLPKQPSAGMPRNDAWLRRQLKGHRRTIHLTGSCSSQQGWQGWTPFTYSSCTPGRAAYCLRRPPLWPGDCCRQLPECSVPHSWSHGNSRRPHTQPPVYNHRHLMASDASQSHRLVLLSTGTYGRENVHTSCSSSQCASRTEGPASPKGVRRSV
jgi:hypothetical protein